MKNVALAVLVLTTFAPLSASAAIGDINIGPVVGLTFPSGDLGDQAGSGFAIGATGDYVLREQISVGGHLIYNPFGGGDTTVGDARSEFDWSVLHIAGHGKYYFQPDASTPFYGTAILGFYRGSADVTVSGTGFADGSRSDSSTEIGLGLGIGVEKTVMDDKTLVGQASIHFGDFDFFMIGASLLFGVGGN